MKKWSSLISKTKSVWNTIQNKAVWAWSWSKRPLVILSTYGGNTFVYSLNQLAALRYAIPALNTSESKKIITAVARITGYKIVPLIALNTVNAYLLTYMRNWPDAKNPGSYNQSINIVTNMTSMLNYSDAKNPGSYEQSINMATNIATALIECIVFVYTLRQSTELVVETLAINCMGPGAFVAHKEKLALVTTDPCFIEQCNFKRRFKGSLNGVNLRKMLMSKPS